MKSKFHASKHGLLLVSIILIFFSGCGESYQTQTTSGRDFLSGYANPLGEDSEPTGESGNISLDEEVRLVASVEPNLRFPARIGLVKLYNGKITNLTAEEAEAWSALKDDLGSDFGEFVPISPLIAASVSGGDFVSTDGFSPQEQSMANLIRAVRLGGARQHLDVILLYEVFSNSNSQSLASGIANWTIVGAYFVPSEKVETVGYANALLLDVRNGYPYGTATASVSQEEVFTTMARWGKQQEESRNAEVASVLKLIPQVENMMKELMTKLDPPSTGS